jgi:hypothetical protein
MGKPVCIDLYCGLGGWSEGFLAEGYECIGYDIEAHDYGSGGYPGTLMLRDVRSIHGSEFKDATCIVGSSPCQEFSYRAMPWSRAKALPPPVLGIELFNAQFRIQREASEAAGHYIPLIVENVRGAQKWVGQARWHYGSFYLWGDVPALMPMTLAIKVKGFRFDGQSHGSFQSAAVAGLKVEGIASHAREDFGWNHSEDFQSSRREGTKNDGSGWTEKGSLASHNRLVSNQPQDGYKTAGMNWSNRELRGQDFTRVAGAQGVKQAGISGPRNNGKGDRWFQDGASRHGSKSDSRKAASAMIAKIPFALAQHIARTFKPIKLELVANG